MGFHAWCRVVLFWLANSGLLESIFFAWKDSSRFSPLVVLALVSSNLAMLAGAIVSVITGRLLFGRWEAKTLAVGLAAGIASITSTVDCVSSLSAMALGAIAGMIACVSLRIFDGKVVPDRNGLMTGLAAGSVVGSIFRGSIPFGQLRPQLLGVAFCIGLSVSVSFAFDSLMTWIEKKAAIRKAEKHSASDAI